MEKRVIIAVVLCVGILMGWQALFPGPKPPPPQPPAQTAPSTTGAPGAPAPSPGPGTTGTPPVAGGTAPSAPGAPAAAAPAVRAERQIVLTTPEVRFVFSSLGGTLIHAQLQEPQFLLRKGDPSSGHDVVQATDPKLAALRISFPASAFAAPADTAWDVSQPSPDSVTFSADVGNIHVEKRYRLEKERYRLHLEVVVTNRGDKPADHHLAIALAGWQDPDKRGGGFFSGPAANPAAVICHVNDQTERVPIDDLAKEPFEKVGAIRWIAADEKFFLLAAVPYSENPPRERRCAGKGAEGGAAQVTLSFAERAAAPGGESVYPFTIFVGPKRTSDLGQVAPGGQEAKLDDAVDVTLAFLSRPILGLLNFFHRYAHNWGLAIVLLTLFIKLVTFYPTQKALLSAKRMQKLTPKMNAIRKKFENDRQRMSVETMNLYKAHGVSPFGGCLPSLIQMPIWIALYSTLNYAVELYRAPFFGHIRDLTAKDEYYVTPLVMGGVMFLQMKMSPTGADPQQQAMMTIMMPLMFTAFSLFLPSGLAVYMLTSYLIGILQQLYVNHLDRKGAIQV